MDRLIIVVLCITLGLLVVTSIVVMTMPRLPREVTKDQLCVTYASEDSLTCGHERDVLKDFLSKAIEKSYKKIDDETRAFFAKPKISLKKYVANRYWDMKPAAKYTGNFEIEIRDGDNKADMVPVRRWLSGRERGHGGGFIRYGIHMTNGRIAVPVSGTYFIYSHLNMLDSPYATYKWKQIEHKNGTIKHSMYKYCYHDNKEVELLTSLTPPTSPDPSHEDRYYTSYIGGLVNLKAGEEISVKVSHIDLLQYPETNCVGLNLI